MFNCVYKCLCFTDSVEDGEKLIKTALDAFGRIGGFYFLNKSYNIPR